VLPDAREILRYEYALIVAEEDEPVPMGAGAAGLEAALFRALEHPAALVDRIEWFRDSDGSFSKHSCQIASFDKIFGFWTSVTHCSRLERGVIAQVSEMLYRNGTVEYPAHFDRRRAVIMLKGMVESHGDHPSMVALS